MQVQGQKYFNSSVFNRPTEAPVHADASVVPDASDVPYASVVPGAPDRKGAGPVLAASFLNFLGSIGRLEGGLQRAVGAGPTPQYRLRQPRAALPVPVPEAADNVSFNF